MNQPTTIDSARPDLTDFCNKLDDSYAKILKHPDAIDLFRAMDNELYSVFRNDPHSVLFTSASEGEGKTTLVLLLGVFTALLDSEEQVVLVDASEDMALTRILCGTSEAVPLAKSDSEQYEKVFNETCLPNLKLVSLFDPNDIIKKLPHGRLSSFVDYASKQSRRIIVDSSAAQRNRDVFALAAIVKHSVTVVKHRGPVREQVQVLLEELRRAGCDQLGVILNHRVYHLPAFLYGRT